MAITRLTDIVTAMKGKWTYGDKDFAYEFEVNQHHNTQYPYMMITPPDSQLPEVYNGWEAYNFEIDFFDLYQTTSQQVVSLDKKWDNLEDLALEWLNNVMMNFNNPTGAGVGVYFLEESIDIKRIKEAANDRLVQIKMNFTMRGVTRCMFGSIPTHYPSQIPNMAMWYSADSNLKFSIPTKQVNYWGDKSDNNFNLSQATASLQPKRYTYPSSNALGPFNDKTRVGFDLSKTNYLSRPFSATPLSPTLVSGNFTIFTLSESIFQALPEMRSSFVSEDVTTLAKGKINIGQYTSGSGWHRAVVSDGSGNTITAEGGVGISRGIITYKLEGDTLTQYINSVAGTTVTTTGFNATGKFNFNNIHLGADPTVTPSGTPPTIPSLEGSLVDVIVYDYALNTVDMESVNSYLNNKYKIY